MAYLTKKEMLAEIHKCKLTYCYYLDKKFTDYDRIVESLEEITPELIEEARIERTAKKVKAGDRSPVETEDLIFRVMTYDHVPLDPERKKRSRAANPDHAQTNFSPFKHFILTDAGPQEVLRSHWEGGFENGSFTVEKGRLSNRIGDMMMRLVRNFARAGSFRSYTYNDEMQGNAIEHLMKIALRFDESKSDNPFGFFTKSVQHCFVRVLNTEKRHQEVRDELLMMAGSKPSMTRQVEHEMANHPDFQAGQKPIAGKRGRKTKVEKAAIEAAIKEENETPEK